MTKFKVTFYPDKKTVEVAKDTTILSAALAAGIYLNAACGGDGVCGKCRVRVRKGQEKRGICLACSSIVSSDIEVEILPESRVELNHRFKLAKEFTVDSLDCVSGEPAAKKDISAPTERIYIEMSAPDLENNLSDLERIYQYVASLHKYPALSINLRLLRLLPGLFRDSDWKATLTLAQKEQVAEIIDVQPGDTSDRNFGVCIDIGTTTVSCQLVNLLDGSVLGGKASYNRQIPFGADVITRIVYAAKENGLVQLQSAVVDTINTLVRQLMEDFKVSINDVTCAYCVGNTTMIHLLLAVDPQFIRRDPYIPVFDTPSVLRGSDIGLCIHPRGILLCAPSVASYVGADITAGVLACGLHKAEELSILIDIGTNGEIAAGNKEFMVTAAASAGPAFEGSGVLCGMRASPGAIQNVTINPADFKVTYKVIGDTLPRGICGSGYLDIIAQFLKLGIIDKAGRIIAVNRQRIRHGELGKEFVAAFKNETAIGKDIVVTESDIDNIKRAKAAIYSAASSLIKDISLDFSRVKRIYISGGFGNYLNIENAITIGLLPDLERDIFKFIGNSALTGSRKLLLSGKERRTAAELARKMTYVELSVDKGYMDEYMAALFFPHTDLARFPSQRK